METQVNFQHSIGERIYCIKTDKLNRPRVVAARHSSDRKGYLTVRSLICSESDGIFYELSNGDYLFGDEPMKKNLWFWSKEDAYEWLRNNYDCHKYNLKPGTKLIGYHLGCKTDITVKELCFGGLYIGGIEDMDEFGYDHSYKEYLKMCEGAWYKISDSEYNNYVMFPVIEDGEITYRFDYIPYGSNTVLQFRNIATVE